MEKAAAGAGAGSRREVPLAPCAALVAGCLAFCPLPGWAQDAAPAAPELAAAHARSDAGMRLEVNASSVPRLENQDVGFQAPRVDLSLAPQKRGLGVVFGMSGFSAHPTIQPNAFAPSASMDLGLRWRQVVASKQVDVTAWRRMSTDEDAYSLIQQRQPMYGARVEMKLDDARKSGFMALRGFLGFQLESGAKISVKRKDGRPMVYYRTSF